MQQFLNDIDVVEDGEYLTRKESRLQKKRRREQQIRRIKTLLGIGVIGIVIFCIGIITGSEPGTDKDEENLQVQVPYEEDIKESEINESEIIESEIEEDEVELAAYAQPIVFQETADTKKITSETIVSNYAILIDADTDTIIGKKNAYDKMIPASMTKVLTVLVAAEAIEPADLEDTFTITLEITDYAYVNDCSSVGFSDGEVVTVKDLFYGTVLASGGDAAVGLATYVAGSHEAFVDQMNAKAEQLGISDTAHFTNCVGLYDEELYCTPYDMAVIMKAAMQNELCRELLKTRIYTTSVTAEHPEGITISNWFMRRIEDKDTGGEVMGGKTGYVAQSGSCAVSYQENVNGTTYICVTADSTSSWRCIYDQVEIYSGISN